MCNVHAGALVIQTARAFEIVGMFEGNWISPARSRAEAQGDPRAKVQDEGGGHGLYLRGCRDAGCRASVSSTTARRQGQEQHVTER